MADHPSSHHTRSETSVHLGSEKTTHQSTRSVSDREHLFYQTLQTLQCALDQLDSALNDPNLTNRDRALTIKDELRHMIDIVQT